MSDAEIKNKIRIGDFITLSEMLGLKSPGTARMRYLRGNEEAELALKEIIRSREKTVEDFLAGSQTINKIESTEQMALLNELISRRSHVDNELISQLYNVVAVRMDWETINPVTVSKRKEKINQAIQSD